MAFTYQLSPVGYQLVCSCLNAADDCSLVTMEDLRRSFLRILLVSLFLFLAGAGFSRSGAQDANAQDEATHLVADSLTDLESADATIRQKAHKRLTRIVEQICQNEQRSRPIMGMYPVCVEDNQTPPLSEAQRASLLQAVSTSSGRIISLFGHASEENGELLWNLLVVADPCASFLTTEGGVLLRETKDCWAFYSALLSIGSSLAPRNESMLDSTVRLLEGMTDAERQEFEAKLRTERTGLFGPTTAGIAIILFYADRVQIELKSLERLIKPKQPESLRLMSLAVLSELGPESHPILTSIRELLVDKSAEIRRAAAFTIAAVERESLNVSVTASQARLSEEDVILLKETHANYAEEADRANKYAVESLSSKQVEQLLEEDHTNVGKRSIFRLAIRFIRNSDREMNTLQTVSYTHLTLPTKRIV